MGVRLPLFHSSTMHGIHSCLFFCWRIGEGRRGGVFSFLRRAMTKGVGRELATRTILYSSPPRSIEKSYVSIFGRTGFAIFKAQRSQIERMCTHHSNATSFSDETATNKHAFTTRVAFYGFQRVSTRKILCKGVLKIGMSTTN